MNAAARAAEPGLRNIGDALATALMGVVIMSPCPFLRALFFIAPVGAMVLCWALFTRQNALESGLLFTELSLETIWQSLHELLESVW